MPRLPLVVRRLLMLLLGVCVTECGSQLFVALGVGAGLYTLFNQFSAFRTQKHVRIALRACFL